jgi:hypothetical protein
MNRLSPSVIMVACGIPIILLLYVRFAQISQFRTECSHVFRPAYLLAGESRSDALAPGARTRGLHASLKRSQFFSHFNLGKPCFIWPVVTDLRSIDYTVEQQSLMSLIINDDDDSQLETSFRDTSMMNCADENRTIDATGLSRSTRQSARLRTIAQWIVTISYTVSHQTPFHRALQPSSLQPLRRDLLPSLCISHLGSPCMRSRINLELADRAPVFH